MKNVEEKIEKVFTKNMGKDIMNKKYNPLDKNEMLYKGDGLFMNETKEIVKLEELICERMKKNQEIFSKEELCVFEKNKKLLTKIYLLGISDTLQML